MTKRTALRLTIALAQAILPKLYQKSRELSEIKILSILKIINKELDLDKRLTQLDSMHGFLK